MKKVSLILFLTVLGWSVNAQNSDDDERRGSNSGGLRVGAGLNFASEIESTGLHLNLEFFVRRGISIQPEYNYFFVDKRHNFWTLDLDLNYYFAGADFISFYGLLGLNFGNYVHDHDNDINDFDDDDTDSSTGINLGAGANFHLDIPVTPFIQLKYTIGLFDQSVVTLGARFGLR